MHWFIIATPNVTEKIEGTELTTKTTTKGATKEQWVKPRQVIKEGSTYPNQRRLMYHPPPLHLHQEP